jgi:hypothetical protein
MPDEFQDRNQAFPPMSTCRDQKVPEIHATPSRGWRRNMVTMQCVVVAPWSSEGNHKGSPMRDMKPKSIATIGAKVSGLHPKPLSHHTQIQRFTCYHKNRPHWHDLGATTMKSTASTSIPHRPLLALQISKERSHYHCNTHAEEPTTRFTFQDRHPGNQDLVPMERQTPTPV